MTRLPAVRTTDKPTGELGAGGAAPPLEGRRGAGPAVMQLTGLQCRWPIGSADSDEFHFCAEPADPGLNPRYCATHRELALSRRQAAMAASV